MSTQKTPVLRVITPVSGQRMALRPGELAQTISQLGYSTYHCSTDLETGDLISATHICGQNGPDSF